ncbi:hemagglutinin repeat-containing protein [Stenotrophomonas maltophilia]|uniref:hemagglutinin repeat-containing protein n=7 Tax=Stenotrophomonas maltophilia TaxID=40324 RepID=UPI0014524025|nr:hemagglutinin repeat-containing protein [Stenotrophomonas maltophilia]MBH1725372.1 hemagglutinin repeat-containing protein [Stenotrophomonas maltophilia]MBH1798209.1 hemagglutinin repeat-containing protein [Stenotrophomonas maltophilia]QJC75733.1 filamentous hemagglutinin N-terminal domain-containing protein [Stenotrophomonas maltophilia]
MNTIYRLVFNRALRVWQVASELVKGGGGLVGHAPGRQSAALSPLGFALMCSLGWVSLATPALAQSDARIISDPNAPGRERPAMVTAPNGVPMVNITTPSAAGVSRNRYSQFDVGREGVILNNARGQVQTQLGGWVQGNPWLATGSARVILNEVNGPASRLNGYVEVAGQRAEVIIANPAGIQVNGGGFLNASRVTLTTGTPMFTGAGALEGYRVTGGAIQIDGAGLDTSRADYTDLITRSLKVNAGIWANQLQATLGNNVVNADHSQASLIPANGEVPTFALDVGALGGMFANKIWLVGNEHGVGVRNAGSIGAQAGELVVTVDGRLENTGALQSLQNVRLQVHGDLANAGTIAATREVAITTGGTLDNSGGKLNAQRLQVEAQGLRNHGGTIEQTGVQALALKAEAARNRSNGLLGALDAVASGGNGGGPGGGTSPGSGGGTPGTGAPGTGTPGTGGGSTGTPTSPVVPMAEGLIAIAGMLDNDGGSIANGGAVSLAARAGLDNSGGRLGVSALQAGGELRNDGGTLQVHGDAALHVGLLSNQRGALSVAGGLRLDAQSLDNRGGELRHAGKAASSWTVQGLFNNDGGLLVTNAAQLALQAGQVGNAGGRIEHAGEGGLTLDTGDWAGPGGRLSTVGRLHWTTGSADLRNGALSAAGFDIVAGMLDNRGGSLLSLGTGASSVKASSLDNGAGGTLAGNGDLIVTATTLDNSKGLVQQAGTGRLSVQADTLHGSEGRLLSNGALVLSGGELDVSGGTTSAQSVQIHARALRNRQGQIVSQGVSELALDVRDALDNQGGQIVGNGGLRIDAGRIGNQKGTLQSAGTQGVALTVRDTLDNSGGGISGNGQVQLQIGSLVNQGGKVLAAGSGALQVQARERLDNSNGGRLAGTGDLRLQAASLDNRSGAIEHAGGGTLQIRADSLQGAGGRILSQSALELEGGDLLLGAGSTTQAERIAIDAQRLDNTGGNLSATGNDALRLHVAQRVDNSGGTIAGNGALDVQAGELINRKGTLSGAGTADSTLQIVGALDNHEGTIASNANRLTIAAARLDNSGGSIRQAGNQGLDITTGHLDGSKGTLVSSATLTLRADDVDHRDATLGADRFDLEATTLDNAGGRIIASGEGASRIKATALGNAGGTLASNGDLTLLARTLDNSAGRIQHAGSGQLQVSAQALLGKGGSVLSNGSFVLDGASLDLSGATTSARRVAISAGTLTTAGGTLTATGEDPLRLRVQGMLDNRGGSLASNGALDVIAQQLNNAQGTLQGAGTGHSTLAIGQALDNQTGRILLGGAGTVTAASLGNQGGTVHAGGSALVLGVDGRLDNGEQGLLSSTGMVTLDAGSLDNRHGTLVAGKDLTVTTAAGVDNSDGAMQAGERLQLQGNGLDNQRGTLLGGQLDIDTRGQRLDNRAGTLGTQKGALSVRSGVLDNQGGRVQSAADLTINTAGQDIDNRFTAGSGGLLAAGKLQLEGGVLDNRGGAVNAQGDAGLMLARVDNSAGGTLASAADLSLRAASLANAGGRVQAGRNLDLTLDGHVDNAAGAIAAGQRLTLTAASVDNRNTGGGDGTRGLQAGQLQFGAQWLDNSQGQVVTDGSARLQINGQLQNTGGVISTGGNLDSQADNVANSGGLLRADGSQTLVARVLSEDGQVHAQRDLGLTLQQGMRHRGEWIANGTLSLNLSGDLDNQGVVRGGNLDLNAQNITNAASGEISSQGTTHLNARGQLTNRGLIDGALTHLEAGEIDNLGTGRIYGDHVAISTGVLKNRAEEAGGATRVGTVAARERLDLGVRELQNTGKGLIYSGGDAAIGGALGADRIASGIAGRIDNISSVIDVSGNLSIDAQVVNNIRENVAIAPTQVKAIDTTVNMMVAAWQKNSKNTAGTVSDTSNYKAWEFYYIAPEDVLQDEPYIAPDGTRLGKAVVRLTANTSRFFFGSGGLGYDVRGERWRMDPVTGTVTIYYVSKGTAANPDQVPGGDPFDVLKSKEKFTYQNDRLTFSSAYGTCSTTCIQFITPASLSNPDATIVGRRQHTQEHGLNEEKRVAHHVAHEDQLQPGAGADAVIRSGGNMRLSVDELNNRYAQIAAGGNLQIVGHGADSRVSNVGLELFRTHTFNNTSIAYDGTRTQWTAEPISEKIGQLGGQITANGTLSIDVGDLSNLNQGRNAPNVQNGSAMANLNVQGPKALPDGPGHGGAQGPGQSTGTGAERALAQAADAAGTQQGGNVGGVSGNTGTSGPRVVAASGGSPDRIAMGAPDTRAPSASLFNVNPNGGHYLVETDPRFTDHKTWLSSDHLLGQMGYSPDTVQKRLGDGYYEQKLVREQIGQLTGRRFLDGYASDEAQYRALLEAGATVASEWGLRPGVALTEAQMAQLTSDIVWLVEQTVTLADGSTTTALVPQVYLRLRPGDLDGQGALLAGANVDIKLGNGLVNTGNIAGRKLVTIDAGNIEHLGGGISGQYVGLSSDKDIRITGATVTATDALSVKAAGNVTVASTVETQRGGGTYQYETNRIDRVAGLYVTNPSGDGMLSVVAGGDISLQAAQIRNAGADGLTQLAAGGTLDVGAIALEERRDATFDERNHQRSSRTTHAASSVQGAGDVVLAAGKDINLAAAQIKAAGGLALQAGGDINSQALVDSESRDFSSAGKRSSLQVSQRDETVRGSLLQAGDNLLLTAGRDVNLTAALVDSNDGAVSVAAGRDVNLLSANETHDYSLDSYDKKKKTLSSTTTTRSVDNSDSYAIGTAIQGERINITAGRDLTAVGAVVDATGNVILGAGNNVLITAAEDHHSSESNESKKKSGVTGGFGNGVASVGYSSAKNSSTRAEQSTTQVGSAIASRDGNVLINAGNTLTIEASDVAAGENLTLVGKDIALLARQDTTDNQSSQASKSSGFSVGVTYDPTKAYRSARDSTTDGMADSGSAMGRITRTAEGAASGLRAATTSTVVTAGSQRTNSEQSHSTSDARVSQLAAGGDLTLIANGGSILSQGTQMSAEGNAVLLATKDIVFDVAHNTERSDSSSRGKGWGFANNTSGLPFGTNNSQSQGSGSSDTITGTQLSVGGGVRMATTEGNISLTAANIAAEKDVNIRAAGDLRVRSGQDTVSNANTSDSKAIGTVQISDTEKFSGWHREQHQDDSAQVSQVASSIGSLGGSVNLTAGGKYTQTASNVVAAKDVNITAAEIELLTADESGHYSQSDKDLKIGVFARVKSPLIDLINNVDAARQSDDRLQKMQGMAAGANAYQAASAISALSGRGGSGELFRAEAGIGFKTANSSADGSSMVSRGSTIQGGGNVNLTSTQGDIHVVQGNLSAGNTLSLDSAGDILLEAGKAHVADRSKSSNAGAEVGVGVVVGAQTGVYVYAEASVGSSKANSDSNTWQNTTLTGQNISLKAEGDTTLRGATATADRIDVKTGGTLTIESLQDIAESMSRNSQVGGRVQVAFGNAWNADGYASAGKAEGNYQGVGQQSGLFAGNGGYHVDAGHVNLVGGAIASTHAGNSELTAGSLTFTDLQNHMDYTASSGSISGGAGGQMGSWAPKPGTAAPRGGPGLSMMEKGSDSSSTLATLTEGNITIGGKQTSAAELGINTDASGAHRALDALPDASKLLADQQAMAAGAGTVMATSQQIAWDVQAYQSKKATQAYYDGLSSDDKKAFNALSAEQRDTVLTANSQAYNDAKKWGDGGEYSRALGAVTTALVGGVAGQGAGQVASNALAPYAAYFIGSKLDSNHGSDPNAALQLLSHAVLGALLAEANGGSAGTGAVSAAGGELAAKVLTNTLTGGNPSELSPEQKEMVLALSQAVGALAGGLSGQDLAGIALNAGIAKNSVENNFLGNDDHARMVHLREKAKRQGGLDKQESLELVLLDAADQMSAGLLRKALAGETLTEVQAADLATYINRYELQNGPLDLPGLQRQFLANSGSLDPGELQGINPSQSYGRPYVGLRDDQKAYKDANYSWFEDLIYRDKGANERLYDAALKQSGLEITRSEDLLPSAMQLRNFFAVHDAQASSAIASAAFIAATLGGASEENRRALTLTMGALANIGAVRFVNRTGLLPQTGGLGVTRPQALRPTDEPSTTNSVPAGYEKGFSRPENSNPPKLQATNDGGGFSTPGNPVQRGVVLSRVNLANGRTRTTPLRDSGAPVSAGFQHVLDGHFGKSPTGNRSIFSINPDELKVVLQSAVVVRSPVYEIPGGQYVRIVDVGRPIGISSLKDGGQPTSVIKVFTDKAGNLITTFPIKGGE